MGMFKDAPEAPDYAGAARAEAQSSWQNTMQNMFANRPNIYTPMGSMEWSYGTADLPQGSNPYGGGGGGGGSNFPLSRGAGGGGMGPALGNVMRQVGGQGGGGGDPRFTNPGYVSPTLRVNLPPDVQAALESQNRLRLARSQMGEGLVGEAQNALGTPMNWEALPEVGSGMDARNRAEDALYRRAASRLDPQWSQRQNEERSRLLNAGFAEGSEGYNNAMDTFSRQRNDAYQGAMDNAITGGGAEMSRQYGMDLNQRQQAISEMLQERMTPFNLMQAAVGGQQVSMPSFPGFSQAGTAQTPNYLGAAQAQYGASVDQANANNAMLGQLMQMGGMAIPFML